MKRVLLLILGLFILSCDGGGIDCPSGAYDCAGVCGGNAVIDDCDICDGGNSDMDCVGECFGSAFIDDCGECVDGSTGLEPCFDYCLSLHAGTNTMNRVPFFLKRTWVCGFMNR